MGLCTFCSSIPLKLFSTDRDKQCTIEHHSSYPKLQASGAAGCELCKLLLDAIQKQAKIGEQDRMYGPWAAEDGKVTVSSTKFDLQHVQFDYRKAGSFRGRIMPAEWRRTPSSYIIPTDIEVSTNLYR